MKTIIKKLSCLFILISHFSFAQDLTVTSGTSLTIMPGTDFYVNGINFNPTSSNLTLTGPIDISRSSTALNADSIDRVFNFSNPLTNFTGDVTFYYETGELNGIDESTLVLRTKNGTTWSADITPARDTGLNTLTYPFIASSFSVVTASKPGITLSINKFNQLKINLFPNPVISSFKIATDLTIETLIYNNLGQVIFKSNQKDIDISSLSAGTYIIIVKDIETNNFNTYQIIKL
ncbi:T9SS type A sorting domain-containing protein [Lutibacter sp.]|uniref:T9SS type A sorting domain-containing protein n=1 Tax=Lutibacter sp. TaxID=1925666 RepID=UPI0034A04EA2